jgi:hypothetical protein
VKGKPGRGISCQSIVYFANNACFSVCTSIFLPKPNVFFILNLIAQSNLSPIFEVHLNSYVLFRFCLKSFLEVKTIFFLKEALRI